MAPGTARPRHRGRPRSGHAPLGTKPNSDFIRKFIILDIDKVFSSEGLAGMAEVEGRAA